MSFYRRRMRSDRLVYLYFMDENIRKRQMSKKIR